jgi:hypothetical protein
MGASDSERSPAEVGPLHAGAFLRWIRDLHLYAGLFISPCVLVFAVSVFPLVEAWLPVAPTSSAVESSVSDLPLPSNLSQLCGRERIDALRPSLDRAKVRLACTCWSSSGCSPARVCC